MGHPIFSAFSASYILISGDQLRRRGPITIATTAIPPSPPTSSPAPPSQPSSPNGNQKAVRGHAAVNVDSLLRRIQRRTTDHARSGPAPLAVVRLQGGRECGAESFHIFGGTACGFGSDKFGYEVQVGARVREIYKVMQQDSDLGWLDFEFGRSIQHACLSANSAWLSLTEAESGRG